MRTKLVVAAALAVGSLAAAPSAPAAPVPPGAKWSQATIASSGGAKLHADILRPANVPASRKTPVILSIGPYFNHSGQTGASGPIENATYDPIGPTSGPSDRFLDFVKGAKLMQRGYTFVMVDLRGFGASTGCLDWGGPGEQSDVVNAVKWAAGQSWSNGRVGMYGKSYDAATGLIGVDKRPAGLKAVVSQEPVYDLYRYLYGDGIRRENSAATPALYNLISLTPGPLLESPAYNLAVAQASNPSCHVLNQLAQTKDDNHGSSYWRQRNFIPGAKGSQVPLFLTQGLTENNTVADGTTQFLRNHSGYERAWLGPWEHVRGNETCAKDDASTGCTASNVGRLKMGRRGFFDETIRFYDRFLKGAKPAVKDPQVAVQTNDGRWRAEKRWPPKDASAYSTRMKTGVYSDDGQGEFTGNGDEGVWTFSPKVKHLTWLAGSGHVTVNVASTGSPANLVVDVYDIDAAGRGPLITRQGFLVRRPGTVGLDLWSADWKVPTGHRIGVRVIDANGDWWIHTPTGGQVTVRSARAQLPFLRFTRPSFIQGGAGVQLADYLKETVQVSAATIRRGETRAFGLPPALISSRLKVGFGRQRYRSRNGRSFRVRCRIRDTKTKRTCAITARAKRGRRYVTVGKGRRSLGKGKRSRIVTVRLNRRGRRLLRRKATRKLRLSARAADKLGRSGKKSKRVKLKRVKKR